jgi:TetR/AcrR family transcriptional regulator, tetracycline repressor protein
MPIIVRRVKVRRRKPGERADLNVEKVIVAASAVLEELGLEDFSGRAIAKKLQVSSAAIYLHVDGGLRGLKVAMARQILSEVARPYRPKDTPAGYLLDLALRFLKAIHRRQATAQLVACELASDYLLCPQFTERVLSVLTRSARKDTTAAQKLDLAMATFVGMALVESCAVRGDVTKTLATDFMARLRALEGDETPTLLEQSGSLMAQIKRRLVSSDSLLRETARRHMDPVIAALALGDT